MRSTLQNILVIFIIILTFLGSGLLFWNFNTKTLYKAVEVETNLSSAILSNDISEEISRNWLVSDDADDMLTKELLEIEEKIGNESIAWILDAEGNCYYKSGASGSARTPAQASTQISAQDSAGAAAQTSARDSAQAAAQISAQDSAQISAQDSAGAAAQVSAQDSAGASSQALVLSQDPVLREALESDVLQEAAQKGMAVRWLGRKGCLLLHQRCCVVRPIYDRSLFLAVINMADSAQAQQRQQFTLFMVLDVLLVLVMVILTANSSAKYRRELIRFATTDELTGLANRKSFNSEFSEYIQSASNTRTDFSIFLLDIDYFKQINDNYGHAAGDHALQYLANQIRTMVDRQGGFAGRWGGDEFIGLLPLSQDKAQEALRDLCRTIEDARMDEGFRMTISAGIAPAGKQTSLVKLSERADLALYESKERGRNRATLYQADMKGAEAFAPDPGDRPQALEKLTAAGEKEAEKGELGRTILSGTETVLAGAGKKLAAEEEKFRKRLAGYVRGKLIDSTILGVRWMAPFVAGGGILIALAFLFDAAAVDLSALSIGERANFGSITEQAAALKNLGGITFNFMLPVFAGFMAYGLAGEEAFMTGFVGGNMTIGSNAGFIGAMIAGFAAGVMTNEVRQFTKRMPSLIRKAGPIIIYPVFNLILMQLLSTLVITPLSSAVGATFVALLDHLSGSGSAAVGALAGSMMAVDMGGIINKVAYNYGVNGLLSARTDVMASVMIGGMVPPLGIALSTVFFQNKYSEEEKELGVSALFMGLSFITEGALPYVFTDPVRVILCCMLGSGTAGLLSMLLGCTLPAPHGGLFVLPVMGHPLSYLAALAAGSLVTACTLGLWKRRPDISQQK